MVKMTNKQDTAYQVEALDYTMHTSCLLLGLLPGKTTLQEGEDQ